MRPISPGDGYVCLLDSKRPVFRWQLAMVIQAFSHAYLEDGNEHFLHCCMRMAGPWWHWWVDPTGAESFVFVCVPRISSPGRTDYLCLVPDYLSPLLEDWLCVLWLFTVKWPLVLLMTSYEGIILLPWNWLKVIVLWFSGSWVIEFIMTIHLILAFNRFQTSLIFHFTMNKK